MIIWNASVFGPVQKSPSSKATAIFARDAYTEYVSTRKWRPACAKPLRRRQGTRLVAFFNRPYNAGPGRIARMRKEAEKRGLDPDIRTYG
ncbi:hypothetical protein [uncultured Nitrospira sp.]|uniref:hypothetical protein n=1 Tax=uncultured Nitrospira sp. TaxID=157176 RepID=UPI00314083CC